jgi:dTDP-4-dehydrorhamnose reductase
MKIFISGASGLVGSNCLKHFKAEGHEVVGTYFSYPTSATFYFNTLDENDEKNFDIHSFNPDIIVHCGALTHVDYCETHEQESFQKTVQSTHNLILLSEKLNAKLVFISTDYVFDGENGPYDEDHTTNPLSIYAKHKLIAERAVVEANKNNLVLRVTNVYGHEERNKNFVSRIIEQCIANEKLLLKLPIDQYATPVNAWDIARSMLLLLQANHEGVFHIASHEFLNRVELAKIILLHFPKAQYELIPMTTSDMKQPASRPLLGGLRNDKFMQLFPDFVFGTVDDFTKKAI